MPLTQVPASMTEDALRASAPNGSPFSMRNKLINGSMGIDQRNAGVAQSFTAAATLAYCVDRWYGYCTGANVSGQRVAGTAPNQFNYQFTGAASVTKIGFSQRIEAGSCQDLADTTATLSVDLANTLLTTVTWTAWRANTADTFGTLASPTRTQIATGTFTVSSTLTRYNAQIAIPSAATTGIEVEFSVGAQTSGTWTIGRAQLEQSSIPTPFEVRPLGFELSLCQRYYYQPSNTVTIYCASGTANARAFGQLVTHPTTMRIAPNIATSNVVHSGTNTLSVAGVRNEFVMFGAISAADGSNSVIFNYTASSEL